MIPKPQSKQNQILVFLSGVFVAILALFYLLNTVDLIPDSLGAIGYLDDIIVLFLLIFFATRFISRMKLRVSRNITAYKELWRKGDLVKLFLKPKTWFIILILAGAFAYFFWTLDVVPDALVGVGYVDDALVAIGALVTIIRIYRD